MPVLRRTLRIRFCWWWNRKRMRIGWDGEFVGWCSGKGKHTNGSKTRIKPATKTRTRTQIQHYGLWKRIMQTAKHCLGRENFVFGFSVDSRMKAKLNLTKVKANLTVNLSLDTTWCRLGFPIFRKVLITLDLVESLHKSIRLPNNKSWTPQSQHNVSSGYRPVVLGRPRQEG